MKNLRLAVLLMVLVAASVAVWMLNSKQPGSDESPLFPELTIDSLNTVNAIEIAQRNSSPINIYLADDSSWRVAEHYDYLANTVKIRELLLSLQDARKIEKKTSLPEYYPTLGVAPSDAEEGSGILMTFKTSDGEFGLIVGKISRQTKNGQYVRKPDEAESWLINARFYLPADTVQWLDKEMIHIEPDTVSTVTVTHSDDSESFKIIRDKKGELTIQNLAKEQVLRQKERLNRVIAVTDYLYFKDVLPLDQVELPEEHVRLNVRAKEGAFVDIKAYKTDDGKNYFIADTNSTPQQQNFRGWAFEVPNTAYDSANKRLSDFLATVPAEEESSMEKPSMEQEAEIDTGKETEDQTE